MRSSVDGVICPRCHAQIDLRAETVRCSDCGQAYPRLGQIPILVREPQNYRTSCRSDLAQLIEQSRRSVDAIAEQLRMPNVLPATRARCKALIHAVRNQTADIEQ